MLKKFLKKQVEQSAELSILKGIVISNTKSQCHPELVSGSQKLRRFRNKFGMTINNSPNDKKDNKNVKNLSPYSPLTICYPCHDYSTCIRKTLVQSYCFHLFK